jgi:hypothetical protein
MKLGIALHNAKFSNEINGRVLQLSVIIGFPRLRRPGVRVRQQRGRLGAQAGLGCRVLHDPGHVCQWWCRPWPDYATAGAECAAGARDVAVRPGASAADQRK